MQFPSRPSNVVRSFAALIIFALGAAPALARPTVIAELGTAPLLGTSRSTQQLRDTVARNEGTLSAAGARLGLTTVQYAQFRAAIDGSHLAWVTVPRHLDAMTWQGGGRVYVIHDVVIPAGTNGWEVDIPEGRHVLALYMPAKCGNLSLVRRQLPAVAMAPPTRVAALHVAPPVAPPVEVVPPAPVVAEAPPVTAPPPPVAAPAPATVAAAEFPPTPVVAAHHGLSLLPLLFGLAAFVGGSSPSSGGPAPIYACP